MNNIVPSTAKRAYRKRTRVQRIVGIAVSVFGVAGIGWSTYRLVTEESTAPEMLPLLIGSGSIVCILVGMFVGSRSDIEGNGNPPIIR